MRDMATFGITHILTDFSVVPENNLGGEPATLADEAGARVVASKVSPIDLIGWDVVDKTLTEIRIKDSTVEKKGLYLNERVTYITKIQREVWERYKITKNDKMEETEILVDSGLMTLGEIPLTTAYAMRTGFLTANPPLEGLAWLNLAHWQSDSDQRNILHFCRSAILFGAGLSQEDCDKGITIGPQNAFLTKDPNARLQYVEHSGAAIGAGRNDCTDLENRMEIMGLQPYAKNSAMSTATGKGIDETRNVSAIKSWIMALQDAFYDMFEFAALWHKVELSEKFSINIFSDFAATMFDASDLSFLLSAVQAGKISQKTFLLECKRRGRLAESVDVDLEIEDTQMPDVSKLMPDNPPLTPEEQKIVDEKKAAELAALNK
jgi:hypothetical protein